METNRSQQHLRALGAINSVALIAIALLISGYLYYQRDKQDITRKQYETLSAVSALKSQQVQRWRIGRSSLARKAMTDKLIIEAIRAFLNHPQNQATSRALQTALAEKIRVQDPIECLLFDTNANLLTPIDANQRSVNPATLRAVKESLATNKPILSDLFRPPQHPVSMDVAAAVRDEKRRPLAVLVMRHNTEDYLFPMLQFWPTPSNCSETVLAQRMGNEVVYLNELRLGHHAALVLREPLTATQIPIVQAALGRVGSIEGTDYRGVNVVSDVRLIPDSPWLISTKMDSKEIYAEARYHALIISMIVGLSILLATSFVAFFYRNRQTNMLKNLLVAERNELAALESEKKLGELHNAIIHASFDGFWIVDRKGYLKEVNEAYCRATGYSKQELLSMRISDLSLLDDHENKFFSRMQSVIEKGNAKFETLHRRKDGTLIDFDVSIQYRPSEDQFVVFFHDITQKKITEAALKRITRLYAALSDCNEAIVRVDDLGQLFSEICRIVVELGGMKMAGIVMPDKATGRIGSVASFGEGKENLLHLDFSLKTETSSGRGPIATALHENRCVWIEDFQHDPMTSPWHDRGARFGWNSSAAIPLSLEGKTLGAIVLYHGNTGAFDESARNLFIRIGANVSLAMEKLSMEEDRITIEDNLYDALDRSAEASRSKSEFLAVMSHELRTPLNGVLGFAELLTTTPLNEEQLDYVQMIQSCGTHLLNIVSEILDFSSLEKGKIKLNSADLTTADLVEASYQTTRKVADDKGLDFHYDIAPNVPATITGDIQRIRQILINLLGNSIKFTASGSVLLRVSVSQESDKRFLDFAVKDTGPGIATDKLDLLFKPFSQVDSSLSRKFQGTGLGLAISKRLAEAMGGTLTVTSIVDQGSTFTFRLPLES